MTADEIVQVKRLRTLDELRDRLVALGIDEQLGVDDAVDPDGPLATPFTFTDGSAGTRTVGNRFAVLPMEGWDGDRRRATHRPRAPPVAPVRRERRQARLGRRGGRRAARRARQPAPARDRPHDRRRPRGAARASSSTRTSPPTASDDELVVGLQLTHSGRWSRPDRRVAAT